MANREIIFERLDPDGPAAIRHRKMMAAYKESEQFFADHVKNDPAFSGKFVAVGRGQILAVGPGNVMQLPSDSEEYRQFISDLDKATERWDVDEKRWCFWVQVPSGE